MTVHSHTNFLFNSVSYAYSGILIDPGDIWADFENTKTVLLTHAHFDHIYGLNELLKISPQAKVYTNEIGKAMLLDARKNLSVYNETPFIFQHPESIIVVTDGDEVDIDSEILAKATFTPGHNPSCITWVVRDMVFSGDSLIPGVKTITNLPKGNSTQAKESELLIMQIAKGRIIYPGHKV